MSFDLSWVSMMGDMGVIGIMGVWNSLAVSFWVEDGSRWSELVACEKLCLPDAPASCDIIVVLSSNDGNTKIRRL